jgi:hypothetical protein
MLVFKGIFVAHLDLMVLSLAFCFFTIEASLEYVDLVLDQIQLFSCISDIGPFLLHRVSGFFDLSFHMDSSVQSFKFLECNLLIRGWTLVVLT